MMDHSLHKQGQPRQPSSERTLSLASWAEASSGASSSRRALQDRGNTGVTWQVSHC